MSEPALRLKVKVPFVNEPVYLRNIGFSLDGYLSADFDAIGRKYGWFNYPAEFEILEVKKLKRKDKELVEDGDGTAILKKFAKQFSIPK